MFRGTLLVAGLVALTVSFVYAWVASRLYERRISHASERLALHHFVLWWGATALNIMLAGVLYVAASIGFTDFPTQLTYALFQRLLLALSLYGLVFYLVFLLTGRSPIRLLAVTYFLVFVSLVYGVIASVPDGVFVGDWRTDLSYAGETTLGLRVFHLALIFLPPVLLSIAGLVVALRPRADLVAAQRYRLGLVCGALIVWWALAIIAGQREALGQEWFQLVNRFVGLLAALVILAAYRPPAAWRRRWDAATPAVHRAVE